MDKRLYDLMKKAELLKKVAVDVNPPISTDKNPDSQWGVDAKKESKKQQTKITGSNLANKSVEGAGTDKNPAAGVEKKASKEDILAAIKTCMTKKAEEPQLHHNAVDTASGGTAESLMDKIKRTGKNAMTSAANTVKANPTTSAVVGGGVAGSAIGTGLGAGIGGVLGGKSGAGKGAAIGAIAGAPTGAALGYLIKKLEEKSGKV